MEIKCNYNETNSTLYLYTNSTFDESVADKITIDVSNHDVKNLHSFFQKRLLEILLKEENEELSLIVDNIKHYDFYNEEPFQKLLDLLNEMIAKVNDTVRSCFETIESANLDEINP